MIEFILGACTAERMTLIPEDWKTSSNAALKLASRSCSTNLTRMPASSRSIRRFRICSVARSPQPVPARGHAEDVRITAKQYERCRVGRGPVAGYRLLDIHLHSFMM